MFKKIKNLIRLANLVNFKDTSAKIQSCDVLLFCHDNDRGLDINGQAYSPLLDSVKEYLENQGYTTQTIAHPWSRLTGKAAFGHPVAINRKYLMARLLKGVGRVNSLEQFYQTIVSQSSPKMIITIGCSDELCRVARDLKVLHAELLHGIGYDKLPWGWDRKNKQDLPQEILTLDELSTRTFRELEKHNISVRQIAHPFFKRFTEDGLVTLPNDWRITEEKKFSKEILVSLQWGYAEDIDCYDEFKGILKNGLFYDSILKALEATQETVLWRFRLHPVHYRNASKYKIFLDLMEQLTKSYSNFEWLDSTYKPLPSVLMRVDGHLTMSSMSSYEAAYFGVPTLALCPTLRNSNLNASFLEDLENQGYLFKQEADLANILSWVSNVHKKKPLLVTYTGSENIFVNTVI